jgi:hypothetical protein
VPYPCEHVCTLTGCYNIRSRPLRPKPRRDRRVLSKPAPTHPSTDASTFVGPERPSVERSDRRTVDRPAPLSLSSPNL